MAKKIIGGNKIESSSRYKSTSIGNSRNTRPKNKHQKKSFKRYRGQGK
jgi:hypothetical protein